MNSTYGKDILLFNQAYIDEIYEKSWTDFIEVPLLPLTTDYDIPLKFINRNDKFFKNLTAENIDDDYSGNS